MIKGDARKFAEQSVAEHPAPTAAEIAEAEAAVGKYVPKQQFFAEKRPPALPVMVLAASLLFYVGSAGPDCGVAVPRRGGIAYCRGDVCEEGWPARLPAAPALAVVGGVESGWCRCSLWRLRRSPSIGFGNPGWPWHCSGLLAAVSVGLRERGLQDRLAGTWPVPR